MPTLIGRIGVMVCFVFTPAVSSAASPETVAGFLYTQVTRVLGAGDAQTFNRLEIRLREGGTYAGLLSISRIGGSAPTQARIPASGQWSYRKTGEMEGQLVLDNESRALAFTSDFSGSIPSSSFITNIIFALQPYQAGAPLSNCSNRSYVRAGVSAFSGFVISEPSRGRVLVRAIGPSLRQFGITDTLRLPLLTIFDARTNAIVARNQGWSDAEGIIQAGSLVGAFPLLKGSADSAVLLSLTAGAYIAEVASVAADEAGEVLIEIYMLP